MLAKLFSFWRTLRSMSTPKNERANPIANERTRPPENTNGTRSPKKQKQRATHSSGGPSKIAEDVREGSEER